MNDGATTNDASTSSPMSALSHGLISDLDLARAHADPSFRRQLVADHLELLLSKLNRLRGEALDAGRARQLREGAQLAVRLAALLQGIAAADPGRASQP